MAVLKIVTSEDPVLRKHSRAVETISPRIITLLDDMAQTLADSGGVGLAAPQVGVLRRVVVIDVDGLIELINPEIVEASGTQTGQEGCLSIPGKWGICTRPNHVKVKALDRNGNVRFYEGEELLARAFCHEIDHLDGKLYIDIAERMLRPDEY